MRTDKLDPETVRLGLEFERIGKAGAKAAQEESRRLGVPNVYSINGQLYYELPNGELSLTDPYVEPVKPAPLSSETATPPSASPPATSPLG